jgi:exopolyphosphatase/guanosine-5'-triphosphate,3'-diphosphate pyrophosphatase
VGASGTIRSIERVVTQAGWSDYGITAASLRKLRKALIAAGSVDNLRLKGMSKSRAQVIPGGFAVLAGAFATLNIDRMEAADGALREGVLYDLVGRIRHEDVRGRSVTALARRYHVDAGQAERVEATALHLASQVAGEWGLDEAVWHRQLAWAAQLHEVGLDISHSQYHKHGGYIVSNTDLAGFSRQEQQTLAVLVRAHRRKFPEAQFGDLPDDGIHTARRLAVLLRLAVVLHRGRSPAALPAVELRAEGDSLRLTFPPSWLEAHALLAADLEEEADYLRAAGFNLRFA